MVITVQIPKEFAYVLFSGIWVYFVNFYVGMCILNMCVCVCEVFRCVCACAWCMFVGVLLSYWYVTVCVFTVLCMCGCVVCVLCVCEHRRFLFFFACVCMFVCMHVYVSVFNSCVRTYVLSASSIRHGPSGSRKKEIQN